MKNHNAKKTDTEPEAARVSSLAGWQSALDEVASLNAKLCEAQAALARTNTEAETLASERRSALTDENEDALFRLLAKAEILTARKERLESELANARDRFQNAFQSAAGHFAILGRIFHSHIFQREKKRLQDSMTPGCPDVSLSQTVAFLRVVTDARDLEIAQNPNQAIEDFIGSAQRLLKAIEATSDFNAPPPPQTQNATETLAQSEVSLDVDERDPWTGPWDVPPAELNALLSEINSAEPDLDRAQVQQRLRSKRPDLFKRVTEVIAMQKVPLSVCSSMDEPTTPTTQTEPTPQATKPAVRAVSVLGCNSHDAAQLHDLSGAHTSQGYVLDYRILSLMPANDVVVHFGLT